MCPAPIHRVIDLAHTWARGEPLPKIDLLKFTEEHYGIRTVRVKVDLGQGGHVFDELKEVFRTHNIGILVNCAGLMYECPQYFHNITDEVETLFCI